MGSAVAISILLMAILLTACLLPCRAAHGQDWHEDLTPCPGSAPEPTQSAAWSVAFCNRTGHDIVIEFHDNDCPAQNWDRRGDVYQRTLRRGESKSLPLCYANQPQPAKSPAPGIPTLRLPGGKGVVTTWSVVGDCGDRSKSLNLDARTFYDRGDYRTGIILLQYPAGASHCVAEAPAAAGSPTLPGAAAAAGSTTNPALSQSSALPHPAAQAQASGSAQPSSSQPPAAPLSPGPAPLAVTHDSAAAAPPAGNSPPALTAVVDTKDAVGRTVWVFANGTGAPGYKCSFVLGLTFTDGGSWNDRVNANVTGAEGNAPIATRKYLKSVSKVDLTATRCSPL
jgi:hypothetical protein